LSNPLVNIHAGLSGRFKLEARKPDGSVETLASWFDNLITDGGLNRWGTGAPFLQCQVGTGTSQPAVTDTALQALVATSGGPTQTAQTAQPTAPYYQTMVLQYTFAQGAVVGNMAEVGVGWPGGLWSRARIKDAGGVDTTITVVALDQLIVSYELRLNIPNVDGTAVQTIGGVSTTITTRAANAASTNWVGGGNQGLSAVNAAGGFASFSLSGSGATAYDGAIGLITGFPSGTSTGASAATRGSYANNSLFVDLTTTFSISQGNLAGGIDAFRLFVGPGDWQFGFSPAIAKLNTQVLTIPLRFSWARAA
jgi:hypothetical protein